MKRQTGLSVLLLSAFALTAQAGVKGQCTYKGKTLVFVDGYAAIAPDPFEETKKLPQLWFTSKPLDRAALARAKPDDIDDAITEQAFDQELATLELRFDGAGTVVEGLQLYVPPGTSQSISSNEVGKITLKLPLKTSASGRFVLGDDDLKCDLQFDLAMGNKGAPAAAKPWGSALPKGGGEPGKVYMDMHRATLAGNVDAMLKLATKARAAEMQQARKEPDFPKMLEMIKAFEPATVAVVSGRADATHAELQIAGKEADGAAMTGTVKLVREDGAWKIENVSTKSKISQ